MEEEDIIAEETIEKNNSMESIHSQENHEDVPLALADEETKNSLTIEDEEIKDDAVVVVDNSPKKERVIEDLPPVEEDIANVVGGSALEEDNIDEVHGEPIPEEVREEPNLNLHEAGFDDPFLIVGKKLSSSSLKQDTLAYSLSPNKSNTTLHDDDSLFKDVDQDLGDHHPSPEKKNPEPKELPVEKDKISPRQQALAKLKRKSSRDVNKPPQENIAPENNNDNAQPPEAIAPSSSSEAHQEKNHQQQPDDKKNNPWESKLNRPKKEKDSKEKEKLKQPPSSNQHKSENELSAQEKIAQAETNALKDKKEREEKLQLKKFKKNIEKLQEPGAQSDKESVADPALKSKRSTRRGSKENNKADQEGGENSSVASSRQQRKSIRRTSQEKSAADDGQDESKSNNNEQQKEDHHSEGSKLPPVVKSRKPPKKEIPPDQRVDEKAENPFFLPDIHGAEKKPVNNKPPRGKFSSNLRNQVRNSKQEYEGSADDSTITTNEEMKKKEQKKKLMKMPHSSPSERPAPASDRQGEFPAEGEGEGGDNGLNASPSKKPHNQKKSKPLYLRMIARANRRLLEEEKMKHEEYQKMKNQRYKQPSRAELKEHMAKFNELLKLKSEEFKHNHLQQMKQLKNQRQQYQQKLSQVQQEHHIYEGYENDQHSEVSHHQQDDNNDDPDNLSMTPKKPSHHKESHKNHHQHRSLVNKDEKQRNQDNDEDQEMIDVEPSLHNDASYSDLPMIEKFLASENPNPVPPPASSLKELPSESELFPMGVPSPTSDHQVKNAFYSMTTASDIPLDNISSFVAQDWMGMLSQEMT